MEKKAFNYPIMYDKRRRPPCFFWFAEEIRNKKGEAKISPLDLDIQGKLGDGSG